jgi:hypothetical protein
LPTQVAAQPHVPGWGPPPQLSGLSHALFAQHVWPLPPHVPHAVAPHVEPLQHPVHDAPSQTQSPLTQCWPLPQVPPSHTPPQVSSAPHALPVHEGVQPQTPV